MWDTKSDMLKTNKKKKGKYRSLTCLKKIYSAEQQNCKQIEIELMKKQQNTKI